MVLPVLEKPGLSLGFLFHEVEGVTSRVSWCSSHSALGVPSRCPLLGGGSVPSAPAGPAWLARGKPPCPRKGVGTMPGLWVGGDMKSRIPSQCRSQLTCLPVGHSCHVLVRMEWS